MYLALICLFVCLFFEVLSGFPMERTVKPAEPWLSAFSCFCVDKKERSWLVARGNNKETGGSSWLFCVNNTHLNWSWTMHYMSLSERYRKNWFVAQPFNLLTEILKVSERHPNCCMRDCSGGGGGGVKFQRRTWSSAPLFKRLPSWKFTWVC